MTKTTFSRTWWGKRFIEALESFTDGGRLARGRFYAKNGKILEHHFKDGKINAKVEGSINPYFGVYQIPIYKTQISVAQIPSTQWAKIIKSLSEKASFVSKLLMNEMPDNIEEVFEELHLHLLPKDNKDFQTKCSCPDYVTPCKHIAGVYYLVAAQLDQDPFLLFELRGLSREKLYVELGKSSLGQVLATALTSEDTATPSATSYYTRPLLTPLPKAVDWKIFWQGEKRLPTNIQPVMPAAIPAILIKKAGDLPPFWKKDSSFIETMEEFYQRIRDKSKELQ